MGRSATEGPWRLAAIGLVIALLAPPRPFAATGWTGPEAIVPSALDGPAAHHTVR